jgi:hypothetical protein
MARDKPSERRVIRQLIRGQNPERDIFDTAPLDPPTRPFTDAVRVQDERDHHRRVVRGATPAIRTMRSLERRQIDHLDRREDRPRQMPVRQPIHHRRRHQELLITTQRPEVEPHARIVPHNQNAGATVGIRAAGSIAGGPTTGGPVRQRMGTPSSRMQRGPITCE